MWPKWLPRLTGSPGVIERLLREQNDLIRLQLEKSGVPSSQIPQRVAVQPATRKLTEKDIKRVTRGSIADWQEQERERQRLENLNDVKSPPDPSTLS